jgi:tetratricopeptide (TPR) repeat protein
VYATEADFEKQMARGVTALDAGNPAGAIEEFRAAVKEHPGDREAELYLAIALNRAGDPSAEAALKQALLQEPVNPRINLELGAHYYNRTMFEEAGDYFENLLTLQPDQEIRAAAEAYLANIRSRSEGKRWSVSLMGGAQYDTNVPLAAGGAQLPVGIDRRSDWLAVLNLNLSGTAYRDNQQELNGSYTLYQTLHLHLNEFDLFQNLFDLTYSRSFSPTLAAKLSGGFELVQLGGERFVSDYTITPSLQATFREGMVSGLEYRFRDSTFSNSTLFPANTERNGVGHAFTLNHRQFLTEAVSLRAGYTYERELADVSAWSSRAHRGNCGLAASLTNHLLLDLALEADGKSYDAIQTGATELRRDTSVIGAASLTWQVREWLGLTAGYHYTNNSSTIPDYEYKRGITSILFQGRY